MMTIQWLVRSKRFPNAVVPVESEAHAIAKIEQFRRIAASHKSQVTWEYGLYDPAIPKSYRRVGP